MAKALKCDACGNFFDYDNNGKKQNKIKIYYTNEYDNTYNEKYYHVCPECMDAIKSMFQEEKK